MTTKYRIREVQLLEGTFFIPESSSIFSFFCWSTFSEPHYGGKIVVKRSSKVAAETFINNIKKEEARIKANALELKNEYEKAKMIRNGFRKMEIIHEID